MDQSSALTVCGIFCSSYSGNRDVWWLHCRLQICLWPSFLCDWGRWWKWTYSGNSLARILWCRFSIAQVFFLKPLFLLFAHWQFSYRKCSRVSVQRRLTLLYLICTLIRNNVDKRTVLENLDLIFLCLDEIVDGGYALALYVRRPFLCFSNLWSILFFDLLSIVLFNWLMDIYYLWTNAIHIVEVLFMLLRCYLSILIQSSCIVALSKIVEEDSCVHAHLA